MTVSPRSALLTASKVGVTLALLAWLSRSIDMHNAASALRNVDAATVAAASLAMVAHVTVLGWRWHRIIDHLGGAWRLRDSMRWTFVGVFFNQALPSSVGGDAVRIWALHSHGAGARVAFGSVAIERSTGLVVVGMIVSISALTLPSATWPYWVMTTLQLVGPLSAIVLVLVVLVGRRVEPRLPAALAAAVGGLTAGLASLTASRGRFVELLMLAAVASSLNLLAAALLGRALHVNIDLLAFIALAGGASLLAVLPISLGGWGVREAGMVALFAPMGILAEPVVIMSVLWGLLPLVVTWPAGLLWWIGRGRRTSDDAGADTKAARSGKNPD